MKKIKVGILFGGKSGEHEVSLASASSIINGLNKDKYDVIPIYISKGGKWLNPSDSFKILKKMKLLSEEIGANLNSSFSSNDSIDLLKINGHNRNERIIDIIIPILHGTFGEDGTIQGMLEICDIPYLGAGVMASAIGMDKSMMKTVFRANGLPVCNFTTLRRKNWYKNKKECMNLIKQEIGFPLFVKPTNLGSSIGISKVQKIENLEDACDIACKYDRKIIIEEAVNAREIECSVLGNDEPIASVPGEIVPESEFYNYYSKYTPGKMKLIVPVPLKSDKIKEIQSYSLKAFNAIDCCGMARVDFLMDKESEKVYVSEINTIPGFTETSVYARLFEATGIKYSDLLDRLINLAFEMYEDKSSSETKYLIT